MINKYAAYIFANLFFVVHDLACITGLIVVDRHGYSWMWDVIRIVSIFIGLMMRDPLTLANNGTTQVDIATKRLVIASFAANAIASLTYVLT